MNSNNITNFSQNSLCLKEKNNLKYNMIPRKLDLGNDNIDCSFFCHLYMQLILERPLRIRFNPRCRLNLGSLEANSSNKNLIAYFIENDTIDTYDFIDFNETICKPYKYYSCNYSKRYYSFTTVAANSTIVSINHTKPTMISNIYYNTTTTMILNSYNRTKTMISAKYKNPTIISDNQSDDSFNRLHMKVFYFMLVFTIIVFVIGKIFIHFLKPK